MRARVIVAHPEKQHSYQVAAGLKKSNMLFRYMTSVYNGPRTLLGRVAGFMPRKFKRLAETRRCDALCDGDILLEKQLLGLLRLASVHIPQMAFARERFRVKLANDFANKVADRAIAEKVDAVVAFQGTSPILFERLSREAPDIVRILDMPAASMAYLQAIYERDTRLKPKFADFLRKDRGFCWNEEALALSAREIDSAQYYLCASTFTIRSLVESGVDPDKCALCAYGVDAGDFKTANMGRIPGSPVRFVYVGGTKEFKGLSYMLDAFLEIPVEDATLTVVGVNNLPNDLLEDYAQRIDFIGKVPHDEMPSVLREHDVMLFPSLGDGFGLVILEGMACGLPVIGSTNSAAVDLIVNGSNGFVVPVQDQESIEDKVRWFVANRDRVPEMGAAARSTAEKYSWARYYDSLGMTVGEFIHASSKGN